MQKTVEQFVLEGPQWDLSGEYPSPESAEIEADLAEVESLLERIEILNPQLESILSTVETLPAEGATALLDDAREINGLLEKAQVLLHDPEVFASCLLSVDSQNAPAQTLEGRLQQYAKRFAAACEPLSQFLDLASGSLVTAYLDHPTTRHAEFSVRRSRERRHEVLSLAEENMVSALSQDGIHAWGRMYGQLSGTLQCEVLLGNECQTMGIAEAAGLLQRPDDQTRKSAWSAINSAWEVHEESCASALNAIAGWRLEMCRKRSASQEVTFLDAPIHMNRMSSETLERLLSIAEEARPLAQRAAKLQARAYGKEALGPWDMRAPAPDLNKSAKPSTGIAFEEALELIADAYGEVNPEMGQFVRMVRDKGWIEGSVGDYKRPGAFCTGFLKSRSPRVYMTYTGGTSDVITLAHELGHAFHSWVMRDLPLTQKSYGMSLAETASTFGETVVRDALIARARTPAEKFDIAWEDILALPAFVLNIPARFEFEKNFYEARAKRPLQTTEIKQLMSSAWKNWYGDSISEADPLFWASKLHFYISGVSFYNFPYLFGYLFSMGLYAQQEKMGADFFPNYKLLLRDTGRMTAEDLAAKHLQVRLQDADFWRVTLSDLERRVDSFEELTNTLF
ncbi:MAG: M3 family oligoendopeptidase [Pseudomonadales bacterium]|nr:M3 family oligoendopeptidase [Pseudomonadales bacterium]